MYKNEKQGYKLENICDNYMTGCIKYSEYEYFDLKDSSQQNIKYSESENFFTYR